jgi:hypothetical protein
MPAPKPAPFDATFLREQLNYDSRTGRITRRVANPPAAVGAYADATIDRNGYRSVALFYKRMLAHRVAWCLVHGEWPASELDHVNHDKLDNRIENLRLATRRENLVHRGKPVTNTSGRKGVTWRAGKWEARIAINGRKVNLGRFQDIDEASKAYAEAAKASHGAFVVL